MFDNMLDEPHHLFILVHIPLVIAMNQHFMFLLPIFIFFCDGPFTFFAHFLLVHSSVFKLIYTRSLNIKAIRHLSVISIKTFHTFSFDFVYDIEIFILGESR